MCGVAAFAAALVFSALAAVADESMPDFTATLQKQIDDAARAGGGRLPRP